jgi:hypothetical protein
LQVTDLQKRTSIVRVVLDDPLVLRDRPIVPLFLDVLLGSLERLLAIDLLHVLVFFSAFGGTARLTPKLLRSAKSYGISLIWSRKRARAGARGSSLASQPANHPRRAGKRAA